MELVRNRAEICLYDVLYTLTLTLTLGNTVHVLVDVYRLWNSMCTCTCIAACMHMFFVFVLESRAHSWSLFFHSRFYPYHYAPYVSDIKGFRDICIEFEVGNPFLPFEQLLAVLPPASKSLLPKAYQVSKNSGIENVSSSTKHYYSWLDQNSLMWIWACISKGNVSAKLFHAAADLQCMPIWQNVYKHVYTRHCIKALLELAKFC